VLLSVGLCAPVRAETPTRQEPISKSETLSLEEITLHPDWRLGRSFDYSRYHGILHTELELSELWTHMVNAWDEHYGFQKAKRENQPVTPHVDFDTQSVIWYADRGSNASFVRASKAVEYEDLIEVHITIYHSDFGSSRLNLWTIPKTNKAIRFVETHEYDERAP